MQDVEIIKADLADIRTDFGRLVEEMAVIKQTQKRNNSQIENLKIIVQGDDDMRFVGVLDRLEDFDKRMMSLEQTIKTATDKVDGIKAFFAAFGITNVGTVALIFYQYFTS